jgi:hypothetical protein
MGDHARTPRSGYAPTVTRGSHWWSEPPWWAWVLMAVGAVVLTVATYMATQRL